MTTWTNIPKATGTSWAKIAKVPTQTLPIGSPMAAGFFLYLTYPSSSGTSYTKIGKASGTAYTKISKATGTAYTKISKAVGTAWTKISKAP